MNPRPICSRTNKVSLCLSASLALSLPASLALCTATATATMSGGEEAAPPTALFDKTLAESEEGTRDLLAKADGLKELSRQVADLQKQCQKLLGQQSKALSFGREILQKERKGMSAEEVARCEGQLSDLGEQLRRVDQHLPKKPAFFVKLLLGDVRLTIPHKTEKFTYKTQYERYKLRMTQLSLGLTLLILFVFPTNMLMWTIFHCFTCWTYLSTTLRENVLIAYGSSIKRWWLAHHYLAILLATIMLAWPEQADEVQEDEAAGVATTAPDSADRLSRFSETPDSCAEFRIYFLYFSVYLAVVQMAQYRYQASVLYIKRSLGESDPMATTTDFPNKGTLSMLVGMLAIGYAWQLILAIILAKMTLEMSPFFWQVPAAATLFFVLFVGNAYTTLVVVLKKLVPAAHKAKAS